MATKRIPFGFQESGDEVLAGAPGTAFNVLMDGKGAIRRRPGITTYSEAPTSAISSGAIEAIHLTQTGELFAVGGTRPSRTIYRVKNGSAVSLSTAVASDVTGQERPVVAETEALLLVAAGRDVQKVDLATFASARLGGSPPHASHVLAHNARLLINDVDTRNTVFFSSPATGTSITGHESWDTAEDFFTGESRPDPVSAIAENTNEIWVWGPSTLQAFVPDPTFIYAPTRTREVGISAPYSVVKTDQAFAWLDDSRRFVVSNGRDLQLLSGPIQADLDGMATVADCWGFQLRMDQFEAMVWNFPTDGRTFCFQVGGGWSQWSTYAAPDVAAPMNIRSALRRFDDKITVVGTSDGKIGKFSVAAHTDLDGAVIPAVVTSGAQNHGTDALKHCKAVHLAFRRGATSGSTAPHGYLSFRDDDGAWSDRIAVSLGALGDRYPVVTERSLGVYRRREWKWEFTGTDELVLLSASEEFDVLGS